MSKYTVVLFQNKPCDLSLKLLTNILLLWPDAAENPSADGIKAFMWKLRCHWPENLLQRQTTVVILGLWCRIDCTSVVVWVIYYWLVICYLHNVPNIGLFIVINQICEVDHTQHLSPCNSHRYPFTNHQIVCIKLISSCMEICCTMKICTRVALWCVLLWFDNGGCYLVL